MTRFKARLRKSEVEAKGEKKLNLSLNLYSKIQTLTFGISFRLLVLEFLDFVFQPVYLIRFRIQS